MRGLIKWKDNVVEHPNRFTVTDDGSYKDIVKAPGEVIQPGTQMSASNFNEMDEKGWQAIAMGLVNAEAIQKVQQKADGLEGLRFDVTLTNTKSYPFNNSKQTVNLPTSRNTKNYTVLVEIKSKTGDGAVGDIVISDKLVNGFKIEFTGAATGAVVTCIVQGGV